MRLPCLGSRRRRSTCHGFRQVKKIAGWLGKCFQPQARPDVQLASSAEGSPISSAPQAVHCCIFDAAYFTIAEQHTSIEPATQSLTDEPPDEAESPLPSSAATAADVLLSTEEDCGVPDILVSSSVADIVDSVVLTAEAVPHYDVATAFSVDAVVDELVGQAVCDAEAAQRDMLHAREADKAVDSVLAELVNSTVADVEAAPVDEAGALLGHLDSKAAVDVTAPQPAPVGADTQGQPSNAPQPGFTLKAFDPAAILHLHAQAGLLPTQKPTGWNPSASSPLAVDAALAEDLWEDCPFSTDLERYRWLNDSRSYIAGGTTAQVFWAERMTGLDGEPERVVVKRVNPVDGGLERDFVEQEGLMLERLQGLRNYCNSVPLYGTHLPDAGHPNDPSYLIMGLAKGKDVYSVCSAVNRAAVKARPGPELEAIKAWAWQFGVQMTLCLIQAVKGIHTKGLYHRDIKPANIVVTGWSGGKLECKLVDWASGRTMDQKERCNEVYTPAYASPEIIIHMNGCCPGMADGPNDIWALGVTLHQILTCASLNWRLAFGSVSAAAPADLTTERLAYAQASLTREHTLWDVPGLLQASHQACCLLQAEAWAEQLAPADKVATPTAQQPHTPLHPIIAGIYEAASFCSADSTIAFQASGVVDLLGGSRGLLDPNRKQRILAKNLLVEHAWLSDACCGCMPLYPIQM